MNAPNQRSARETMRGAPREDFPSGEEMAPAWSRRRYDPRGPKGIPNRSQHVDGRSFQTIFFTILTASRWIFFTAFGQLTGCGPMFHARI